MSQTPQIKTEIVSEVSFTKDQLVELVQAHYGDDVIPRANVEADAIYGFGKLAYVKFIWSRPESTSP
jgi:hypothetical protein